MDKAPRWRIGEGDGKNMRLTVTSVLFVTTAVAFMWSSDPMYAQLGAKNGEWRSYDGDVGGTRYSPLDQINAANFNKLEIAWRLKTDNLGPRPEYNFQSTPLVANGVLYSTAGSRRAVIAVDAATGEMRWIYSRDEGARGAAAPRLLSGRGLAYWSNGKEERIIYVTPGYRLVALNATIGRPVPTFGRDGVVDLKQEMDQDVDLETGDVGLHATPIVTGNTIIVGAAHSGSSKVKGYVRAYDAVTGKRLWVFHTVPRPGEFGNDTWLNDSWAQIGNTGVWAQMSVDEELGIVYVPVETPTNDTYGGHRPGNGLFGNSLVALDVKTGKRVWHFQITHHELWDYDLPCAPILANITVDGRRIKAVAQPTKQAWLYVFDRVTGRPVWPIEERPVPIGDVKGEWYSPTQPFVTKPPAYDRQGVTIDDLIDFTPELRAEAVKLVSQYKLGPLFTPPVVRGADGPRGTLMMPAAGGGTNWGGGSLDPETQMVYVFSNTLIYSGSARLPQNQPKPGARQVPEELIAPGGAPTSSSREPTASTRAVQRSAVGLDGGGAREIELGDPRGLNTGLSIQGLPLVKPPWGRITAIDLNKGTLVWQVPHGGTPDTIRKHPALKGVAVPPITGWPGAVKLGTLVTKTLVISGDGGIFTTPSGQRGAMLRAYDKATGEEKGAVYMPASQTGSPMTYMLNGKQYIVVATSGGIRSGELLAFRLPD